MITWERRFLQSIKYGCITDADYVHAKIVCKDFETKNLGEYHYLYVQNNTLLLVDVLENFRNTCLKNTDLIL